MYNWGEKLLDTESPDKMWKLPAFFLRVCVCVCVCVCLRVCVREREREGGLSNIAEATSPRFFTAITGRQP